MRLSDSVQAIIDAMDGIAFLVDETGEILGVGRRNWRRFAEGNNGFDIADPDAIIGRPILDYVGGLDVRGSISALIAEASGPDRPEPIVFSYRCDSPETRRLMRMAITALPFVEDRQAILFQSTILDEQARPPVPLLEAHRLSARLDLGDGGASVLMCSYCHAVKWEARTDGSETWVAPEDYYRRGGRSDVGVSHGICPECIDRARRPAAH